MRTHTVQGGAGLKLHVRDFGPVDAPAILLLHGWSQHHLCWSKQVASPLASEFRIVAPDLRGHGQSEAPPAAENYTLGKLWAEDVDAIIRSLDLTAPVLVGWSYGGLVIGDYLRVFGDNGIAGINLVCGAIGIGPAWFGTLIGSCFVEYAPLAASDDQPTALQAIQSLLHRCFERPVLPSDIECAVGWSMLTSPAVRGGLISREEDFRPDFSRTTKPLLVTFGDSDAVVLPSMAEAIRECCPAARMSEYRGVGHAPFIEDAERFNAELGDFAKHAFGQ